jgi:hypothetical protein
MDEHEHHEPKRIDLNSEFGLTRRDLIRRGAIVAGTLVWVAPAIQSLAPKALAQVAGGPSAGGCAACLCYVGTPAHIRKSSGQADSIQGNLADAQACDNWCRHLAPYNTGNGAPGNGGSNKSWPNSAWCMGTTGCQVQQGGGGTLSQHINCP